MISSAIPFICIAPSPTRAIDGRFGCTNFAAIDSGRPAEVLGVMVRWIQQANAGESRARPDLVRIPTLVLVGDDDRLAGPPEALAAAIPDGLARAVTVHGNHLTAMFDPAFTRAIVDFLAAVALRH